MGQSGPRAGRRLHVHMRKACPSVKGSCVGLERFENRQQDHADHDQKWDLVEHF